jgi:transposase
MKLHRNAALSWSGRRVLVDRVLVEGWTLTAAAEAAGVSVRCARKWVGRYRLEGAAGLSDRSSAPRRVANRTPDDRVAVIVRLRQLRMTAAEVAETLAMPLSTVSVVLKRQGMGRLGRIGLEQPQRYQRERPGELVHGKAERFIRTLINGWAYGAIYSSSHERTRALDGWLWHYNHRRRHSALGHQPPVSRTNLLGSYT